MKIPLFDLDGTLIKSGSNLNHQAFSYAVKKVYGIDAQQYEINAEGMLDNQIILDVLKIHGLSENEIKDKIKLATNAITEYGKINIDKLPLEILPGAIDLLTFLKNNGVKMGILTGNVENFAWTKLKKIGLKDFLEFGAFGDKAFKRVELVEQARQNAEKTFGKEFKTQDFVIVGDTPKDIECARDAGIKVIIVSTGKFSYEDLEKEKPDLLLHTLEDTEKIINFLRN